MTDHRDVEIGPLRVVPEGAPPAGEPAKTPAPPEKN